MALWLDNPKHRHHKKHHGHHGHHHRHNPYLAVHNPALANLAHYFSMPYLSAGVSGIAGVGVTYLGEKLVFSLGPLAAYGIGTDYVSVGARGAGRVLIAFGGDAVLARLFSGHNRIAYAAGAAAYAVGATLLELMGYSVQVGAGPALVSLLPAQLRPVSAFVRRPTVQGNVRAFVREPMARRYALAGDVRGVDAPSMYYHAMHPMR